MLAQVRVQLGTWAQEEAESHPQLGCGSSERGRVLGREAGPRAAREPSRSAEQRGGGHRVSAQPDPRLVTGYLGRWYPFVFVTEGSGTTPRGLHAPAISTLLLLTLDKGVLCSWKRDGGCGDV